MNDQILRIPVHFPKLVASSNQLNKQDHWMRKELADFWRPRVKIEARNKSLTPVRAAWITFGFRFPNNRIRDCHNLTPTAKPAIDGLVDAGVLPDDDDRYVLGVAFTRIRPNGPLEVMISVREMEPWD